MFISKTLFTKFTFPSTQYIGYGYRWVHPRTYEPFEEYSHSLGNIREYISEICIPEITTFEEFMDAKKSHQLTNTQTACYSEDEEEGNCDYVSLEEIEEEEYDSDSLSQ